MSQQQMFDDVTVDKHARREDDFYRTPAWMTQALLRRIVLPGGWQVLCPCAGDGAIVRQLPADVHVITNDIVQRDPLVPDFLLDATQRRSWDIFGGAGRVDLTLDNPTFELTFPIAQHAVERSRMGVALLQRCTWPEPTEERDEWLAMHPPSAEIRMPRWNFRSVDGKGGSDSACPSWFIWNTGAVLCTPGMHIVTRRERDELHATFGRAA
jgi:hypothetical protein